MPLSHQATKFVIVYMKLLRFETWFQPMAVKRSFVSVRNYRAKGLRVIHENYQPQESHTLLDPASLSTSYSEFFFKNQP